MFESNKHLNFDKKKRKEKEKEWYDIALQNNICIFCIYQNNS